jgi:hypothetical protein
VAEVVTPVESLGVVTVVLTGSVSESYAYVVTFPDASVALCFRPRLV